MADMTATTLATYLQEIWSKLTTTVYSAKVMIEPLMDHTWEPETGVGRGDTVNIPTFTESTSSEKRSTFGTGAGLTFTAVTEAQVQILIDQMAYKAFQIPAEMSLQIMTQYVPKLTSDIGNAIAQQIDTELAGDNSNGFDALTAVGADNEAITEELFIDTETVLNDADAPEDGRMFFCSPKTRADLIQIEIYRNSLYASSQGTLAADKGAGFLGRILTVDVYMTNKLEAGTNGKKNAMIQKECIAFAGQSGVKVVKDLEISEGLFEVVAGWRAYGFKLVKSSFGREVDAR